MNPFDSSLFTAPSCLPCCTPAPADCSCALLIPPFASPYADYATAETAIADQVFDCLAYIAAPGATYNVDVDTSTPDVVVLTIDDDGSDASVFIGVSLKAGAVVTVDWAGAPSGDWGAASLYYCDNTEIDTFDISGSTGSDTFSAATQDGVYFMFFPAAGVSGATITVSSDDTMIALPVIALWDDSGTTRRLWACPKLLLPPLTEDTGTWYADCAAADAVLTSDQVSNCAGYIESLTGITTFTATDNTTDIELVADLTTEGGTSPIMWAGFNGEAGETLLVTFGGTFSGLPPVVSYEAFLYDDTGVLIDSSGVVSSAPFEWQPTLPYTGRYTISFFGGGGNCLAVAADITATGTFSVNPIQARYDLGLDCSGNLDCGDSCP